MRQQVVTFKRERAATHVAQAHRVEDDAHGPDIDLAVVAFVSPDLRRPIGRRARLLVLFWDTLARVARIVNRLGVRNPKVDDLRVAVLVNHDVFGLEVAVDDALGMQCSNRARLYHRVSM